MPLPALAAIALYMILLAGNIVYGVINRLLKNDPNQGYPAFWLVFAILFITAGAGLIRSFRWAWALTLAAVLMLVIYNFWIFSATQDIPAIVQGMLNLIFFLYLIRLEVRERLV